MTIVERGVYTLDTTNVRRTPSGIESGIATNICRVAATDTVPATQGVRFGIRYRINGASRERPVVLRRIVHFPAQMRPPAGPQPVSTFEASAAADSDKVAYWGFGLDHPWEILPGPWTFEFWAGSRKLAEVTFNLVEGAKLSEEKGEECFQLSS